MRVLAGCPKRVFVCPGVIIRNRCTRLHGVWDQAIVGEIQFDHMGGVLKGRLRFCLVSKLPVEACIARCFRMNLWRGPILCRAHIRRSIEDVIVDVNQLSC